MDEMNKYFTQDAGIDYTPEVVDIEGLQGINSKQGMDQFFKDMNNFKQEEANNINNYHYNGTMPGYDYYYAPEQGYNYNNMPGMNYQNMNGTCAEVIRCMAYLCYNMSIHMMQMLQGGCGCNGMYQNPMQNNYMNNTTYQQAYPQNYQQNYNPQDEDMHGYPPIM